MSSYKKCTPTCKYFRCEKRPSALTIKKKGQKRIIWCTWANDWCVGPDCKFASCTIQKMTPDGRCLLTKKKSKRHHDDEPIPEWKPDVKISNKLIKKRFGKNLDDLID